VRKTANDDISKRKDDIFDQYLEDPDWGTTISFTFRGMQTDSIDVTPRAALPENIERFLDLSASEEDHGEVSVHSGRKSHSC
jgi:transcription initiation factor TFIIH subunit 1